MMGDNFQFPIPSAPTESPVVQSSQQPAVNSIKPSLNQVIPYPPNTCPPIYSQAPYPLSSYPQSSYPQPPYSQPPYPQFTYPQSNPSNLPNYHQQNDKKGNIIIQPSTYNSNQIYTKHSNSYYPYQKTCSKPHHNLVVKKIHHDDNCCQII